MTGSICASYCTDESTLNAVDWSTGFKPQILVRSRRTLKGVDMRGLLTVNNKSDNFVRNMPKRTKPNRNKSGKTIKSPQMSTSGSK